MPTEIYLSQKDTKDTQTIKVEEKLDTDVVLTQIKTGSEERIKENENNTKIKLQEIKGDYNKKMAEIKARNNKFKLSKEQNLKVMDTALNYRNNITTLFTNIINNNKLSPEEMMQMMQMVGTHLCSDGSMSFNNKPAPKLTPDGQ